LALAWVRVPRLQLANHEDVHSVSR
jgi:hypothetical protein